MSVLHHDIKFHLSVNLGSVLARRCICAAYSNDIVCDCDAHALTFRTKVFFINLCLILVIKMYSRSKSQFHVLELHAHIINFANYSENMQFTRRGE